MMNIAICDDNKIHIQQILTETISFYSNVGIKVKVETHNSLSSLFDNVQREQIDIILMDIQFDEEKVQSFDAVNQIANISPNTQIIFITAFPEFFPEVYQCDHIYTVLKNDLRTKLPLALEKAYLRYSEKENTPSIILRIGNYSKTIHPSRIHYLEKSLRKIAFYYSDAYSTFHELYSDFVYGKFDEYLCKLPNSFIQVHRSYIVNMDFIDYVKGNQIFLLNHNIPIPISKTYKDNFVKELIQHTAKKRQ